MIWLYVLAYCVGAAITFTVLAWFDDGALDSDTDTWLDVVLSALWPIVVVFGFLSGAWNVLRRLIAVPAAWRRFVMVQKMLRAERKVKDEQELTEAALRLKLDRANTSDYRGNT